MNYVISGLVFFWLGYKFCKLFNFYRDCRNAKYIKQVVEKIFEN